MMRQMALAAAALIIAGVAWAEPGPAVSVSASVSGLEGLGAIDRAYSPVVRKATYYYCRRDCTWCRNDCYSRYRVYCYGPSCRRSFVLCMRECWNNICRYC